MAKGTKRLLALLLALMLCAALLSTTSLAEDEEPGTIELVEAPEPEDEPAVEGTIDIALPADETEGETASGECGDFLTWSFNPDTGVLTIAGTRTMYNYSDSSLVPWSSYRELITSVVLLEGVASIGDYAFCDCPALASVTIPESVTSIGRYAFCDCPALTSVTIPESVSSLRECTFCNCTALTSVTIPASLTSIVVAAFSNCTGLTTVFFNGYEEAVAWNKSNNKWSTEENDALFDATWVYGSTLEEGWDVCGNALSWHYDSGTGMLTVKGVGPMWEFNSSSRPWVDYCDELLGIKLEPGPTSISKEAFCYCTRLRSVELSEGLTSAGDSAFSGCDSLTSVVIPESLTTIRGGMFGECERLKTAGPLEGDYNIRFGWKEAIPARAFSSCGLEEVTIPEGVTSIGSYAFSGCALTSISLPEGVTRIEQGAFSSCWALTSVTFPASVNDIEWQAFNYCDSLTEIWFEGSAPRIDTSFYAVTATAYYPSNVAGWTEDVLQDYGGTLTWVPYEVEDGLLASGVCGEDLTWSLTALGALTITGTGDMDDWEWNNGPWYPYHNVIVLVSLPDDLTNIADYAFYQCGNLPTVDIPSGVTSIGNHAFEQCFALSAITIPDGVTGIGDSAFHYCTGLTSVTIPENVTSIGVMAFGGCRGLKNVVFLGSAPEIGGICFVDTTATAYYPADDDTWTEDVRQDYGGKITWVPYTGEPMINVFTDVQYGKYYYEPVLWAYYHDPQITGGISETEFGPGNTCTREQIVTFLWKACGAPEPVTTANPFVDVPEGKWYYKPVLWAVEKGITGGMDATHFGVGKPCTRGQIVTFLYKAKAFLDA